MSNHDKKMSCLMLQDELIVSFTNLSSIKILSFSVSSVKIRSEDLSLIINITY